MGFLYVCQRFIKVWWLLKCERKGLYVLRQAGGNLFLEPIKRCKILHLQMIGVLGFLCSKRLPSGRWSVLEVWWRKISLLLEQKRFNKNSTVWIKVLLWFDALSSESCVILWPAISTSHIKQSWWQIVAYASGSPLYQFKAAKDMWVWIRSRFFVTINMIESVIGHSMQYLDFSWTCHQKWQHSTPSAFFNFTKIQRRRRLQLTDRAIRVWAKMHQMESDDTSGLNIKEHFSQMHWREVTKFDISELQCTYLISSSLTLSIQYVLHAADLKEHWRRMG